MHTPLVHAQPHTGYASCTPCLVHSPVIFAVQGSGLVIRVLGGSEVSLIGFKEFLKVSRKAPGDFIGC